MQYLGLILSYENECWQISSFNCRQKHEYMFVRLANDIIGEQESVLLLGIAIDIPLAKTRLIQ